MVASRILAHLPLDLNMQRLWRTQTF